MVKTDNSKTTKKKEKKLALAVKATEKKTRGRGKKVPRKEGPRPRSEY